MFSVNGKICLKWPQIGPGRFFPNLDLASILGRTDSDFENFYFLDLLDFKFPEFLVSRFPGPQKSGLGQAWARLGPCALGWLWLAALNLEAAGTSGAGRRFTVMCLSVMHAAQTTACKGFDTSPCSFSFFVFGGLHCPTKIMHGHCQITCLHIDIWESGHPGIRKSRNVGPQKSTKYKFPKSKSKMSARSGLV